MELEERVRILTQAIMVNNDTIAKIIKRLEGLEQDVATLKKEIKTPQFDRAGDE